MRNHGSRAYALDLHPGELIPGWEQRSLQIYIRLGFPACW